MQRDARVVCSAVDGNDVWVEATWEGVKAGIGGSVCVWRVK